jgi:competence protein ComEC
MLRFVHDRIVFVSAVLLRYPLAVMAIMMLISFIAIDKQSLPGAIIITLVCGLILAKSSGSKMPALILAGLVLGIFQGLRFNLRPQNHVLNFLGESGLITAEILQPPKFSGSNQQAVLKPKSIKIAGSDFQISGGLILLLVPKYSYSLAKGDQLILSGKLELPDSTDSSFDYKGYLQAEDIYAVIRLPQELTITGSNVTQLDALRGSIITTVRRNLHEPDASLLLGMLIGTREELPAKLNEVLAATGTTHIIAVSGYNVTALSSLILSCAGLLPRKLLLYFTAIFLVGFLVLVGPENAPAFRAVVMGIGVLYGQYLGRKSAILNMLSLSCLVIFLQNPYAYASLSFQLSFAAVFGLVTIQPKLSLFKPKFIAEGIFTELSTTVSANIATFPFLFAGFGNLNPSSPLINLVAIPIVPLIMFFGGIYLFLTMIGLQLRLLVAPAWLLLELLLKVLDFGNSLPGSHLNFSKNLLPAAIIFAGVSYLLIFEFSFLHYRNTKNE